MIKIGFTMIGGRNWTGGYNYLLNLVTLLTRYRKDEICPVVFFGTDVEEDEVAPFCKPGRRKGHPPSVVQQISKPSVANTQSCNRYG